MKVFDYNLQNKGAAVTETRTPKDAHPFTYVLDESGMNLHIYCDEKNDNWISSRDNGSSLNMDASTIAKLITKGKAKA